MMYFWETSILGSDTRKDKDDKTYVVSSTSLLVHASKLMNQSGL